MLREAVSRLTDTDIELKALALLRGAIIEETANRHNDDEPPLSILLQYARIAGVHLEEIVDDDLELPSTLLGSGRSQALKRRSQSSTKRSSFRRS